MSAASIAVFQLLAAAVNLALAIWSWGLDKYGWAGLHAGLVLFLLGCFVIGLWQEKK